MSNRNLETYTPCQNGIGLFQKKTQRGWGWGLRINEVDFTGVNSKQWNFQE